ncbi:GroES-like protein [Daldinia sp. FL1419]|nr:GroES-like protein [Daldinia sp. FL1419]
MATHLAAFVTGKEQPLEVREKPTPKPGPDELLIDVKSIALNPIDWKMRDLGFFIAKYPAVIGSDVGGVVLEAGSNVSSIFKPGTRVTAFAQAYFTQGDPDYGAFQKRPVIPARNATPLPDYISFNEAAALPMAVATTWSGWETVGLPRDTSYSPSDKQGLLVWGAASSVGSMVVQSAKLLGFTVYATASSKHHEYIKTLGATKVFDYKEPGVKDAIIKAAKEDGLTFQYGYDAVGAIQSCQNILKALKKSGPAHLASAPRIGPDEVLTADVETKFVAASSDPKKAAEQFSFMFNTWLKERLEKRDIVPSPHIQVLEGGLNGVNKGLDTLKAGVSGTKLVLEL